MEKLDYSVEIKRIESYLVDRNYTTVVKDVGWLFEMALKDLYIQQISFFKRNSENVIISSEYSKFKTKRDEMFPDFIINRATFAQISYLFHQSQFNALIELRINNPLTFSNKIPWKDIRELRNLVTHKKQKVTRKEAIKFINYIATYIKETHLNETLIIIGEIKCFSCNQLVNKNWKYCPSCGANLSNSCSKCGTKLNTSWKICPECQTPRSGVKVEKPGIVYKYYCQAVWSDGYLNNDENNFLKLKRLELGLSEDFAEKIENKFAPINALRFRDYVEACLIDEVIDENEKTNLRNKTDDLNLSHSLANSIYLACINSKIEIPLFENI